MIYINFREISLYLSGSDAVVVEVMPNHDRWGRGSSAKPTAIFTPIWSWTPSDVSVCVKINLFYSVCCGVERRGEIKLFPKWKPCRIDEFSFITKQPNIIGKDPANALVDVRSVVCLFRPAAGPALYSFIIVQSKKLAFLRRIEYISF